MRICVGLFVLLLAGMYCRANQPKNDSGFLSGLLDPRSRYGEYWFPEPLRAPEMDVDREFRVDWLHTEKRGKQNDEVVGELEYNVGLLSLELEVPYERESGGSSGIGNIELAARHPVYQYVSPEQGFDYTLVGAFELAVPTESKVSQDTELVPQVFQLMRFGEHFSVQTSLGYSIRVGPVEGGESGLEYSAVFGYALQRDEFRLPGVDTTIPILEFIGEHGLSKADAGENTISGTLGARFILPAVGSLQPRLGIGYVFPINHNARNDFKWGVISSLVFEY